MSEYKLLKQECYQANMELNELGLVIYTFGNVSAVDRKKGVFAIKPSGVAYEVLKPEDIVILDFDNNIIEGEMRPSSDTKTHAFLYKNWDDIGGIAQKSPFIMQMMSDVLNMPIKVVKSEQACALGAAIFGAVAANLHEDTFAAMNVMASPFETIYQPNMANAATYKQVYERYNTLGVTIEKHIIKNL